MMDRKADSTVPQAPAYEDPSQWYVKRRGAKADLFYILSTETEDHRDAGGELCPYADTYMDSLRELMEAEMRDVDILMGGSWNYYAPFYRQCSIQSFSHEGLAETRLPLPVGDVRRAFARYMECENHGRPFILAGYSQGAMIALQLLREMDDAAFGRMVAAYLIGISLPQELVDGCPRIRPARGADDVGVTVCYNSVREPSSAIWPRSAVAINPVNWRIDAEPAVFATEPSPFIPLSKQRKDPLTVRLDPGSNLLLVDGYSRTDYVLPVIGKEGNYHALEIWLYRDHLRENLQARVDAFLRHNPKQC